MTEINPDSKSQNVAQQLEPALPIPIPDSKSQIVAQQLENASGDERHECECGKTILKKNVNAHLKTAAHLKATAKPNAENLAPIEDNTNEPVVKKDAAFKIKSEFDIIQSKLDLLLEMVADVHAAEFESDDEDEEAANN